MNRIYRLRRVRVFSRCIKDTIAVNIWGNITQMDYALGMVLGVLDKQGVSGNTLIVYTSGELRCLDSHNELFTIKL